MLHEHLESYSSESLKYWQLAVMLHEHLELYLTLSEIRQLAVMLHEHLELYSSEILAECSL